MHKHDCLLDILICTLDQKQNAVSPNAIAFWPTIAYKVNLYDLVNATQPPQVTLMGKQFCLGQVSLVASGCLQWF